MKLIKVYKFLTYFLTLPTLIVALFSLVGILVSLANPPLLLAFFIAACTVVYFISSFVFFWRTLITQRTCKKIIKDLIRINGFISILFAVYIIMGFLALLMQPNLISKGVDEAIALNGTVFPSSISKEMVIRFMWFFMSLIAIYAAVLLAHIVIGFRLIKAYANSFLPE